MAVHRVFVILDSWRWNSCSAVMHLNRKNRCVEEANCKAICLHISLCKCEFYTKPNFSVSETVEAYFSRRFTRSTPNCKMFRSIIRFRQLAYEFHEEEEEENGKKVKSTFHNSFWMRKKNTHTHYILLLPWPTNHFSNDDTYISLSLDIHTDTMAYKHTVWWNTAKKQKKTTALMWSTILSLSFPKLDAKHTHTNINNQNQNLIHFVALSKIKIQMVTIIAISIKIAAQKKKKWTHF